MRDIDDIDNIFRIFEDMMDSSFSGAYKYKRKDDSTDIQEDDKHIYVTIELKVQEEDFDIQIKEEYITIQVMLNGMWKKKSVKLPTKIIPNKSKTTFVNGVLDIVLEKYNSEE